MRIVYTGATGQVALALARLQPPANVELTALARPALELARPWTVGAALKAAQPDVLVSIAAYTAVDKAEANPDEARRINAESPGELARAAADLGAPVLHLSTDYVFDGRKAAPYLETDAPNPQNVYGMSKLAGELAVLAAQPRSLILRTSWVHAPWGSNFVRTMLRLARDHESISVVADQRGSPTYAPDLASALLELAVRVGDAKQPFGVYHMAGSDDTSWADFAAAVFDGARARGHPLAQVKPIASHDYPTAAARPANSRLDCGKLERDWGVRLRDWRLGLADSLDVMLGSSSANGASV